MTQLDKVLVIIALVLGVLDVFNFQGPFARISADRAATMPAIARAFPSSFVRALRSPPERGVG